MIKLARTTNRMRGTIALLIATLVALHCFSLYWRAPYLEFHIYYDANHLGEALAMVVGFSLIGLLFVFGEFSFGYFVGFSAYLLIIGYLWLSAFSDFTYDHRSAQISAVASGAAFLLPSVLIRSPLPRTFALSEKAYSRLLFAILAVTFATLIAGAQYNFNFASLRSIALLRDELKFPTLLAYVIPILSTTLLPFAFACFVMRGALLPASLSLLFLFMFYAITLTKLTLFAPFWLIFIFLLSRSFDCRISMILALLVPLIAGTAMLVLAPQHAAYSQIINLRMFAIPSNALDYYNHFFAHHPLTHFCQIWLLKPILTCPYDAPLSIIMKRAYDAGNMNASLFATEGVASVGIKLAPLAALAGGLVMALGNCASARLPARFVLTSSALLPQVLTNVPLSTTLLTNGMALVFMLWYLMPEEFLRLGSPPARQVPSAQ
ncbi:hypothetical protein MTR72_39000 [Bradyrhizobium sp. ISRA442]|uniref:hypothetical protein n=1 Tax=Bradyrhizobium sp. ISRA442 TaxID=2866197 RepID=UPI00311B2724